MIRFDKLWRLTEEADCRFKGFILTEGMSYLQSEESVHTPQNAA